uniref:ABC transporter domain-containing protein n=1 Tax=Bombyx mori TaxID=7091 RepID=A0A8R2QXD6_BOMMO|nr:uncharacterized protein LOC101740576 isoform X2 [Bombyx mori]
MAGRRQLRLLLWKDYLIRKRKIVTLGGIVWTLSIMMMLYVVRINVDNQDFPSCTFPARALPSAGTITFLQSFICSVNNECSPMDDYEEIPAYENSKLSQIRKKLAPIMNETVLDVVTSVPDALKLLSTLADVADEPAFVNFTKNGLIVQDLFTNTARMKRYAVSHLGIDADVAQSLMNAQIKFEGILKGNLRGCSEETIEKVLLVGNKTQIEAIAKGLCSLTDDEMYKIFMDLIMEINFGKYIKMFGGMYYKLSGDKSITQLGDMLTSIVRMINLKNFLPQEIINIAYGDGDFSYFDLGLITKLVNLFESTFGETLSFKSINEFADTAITSIKYLDKIISKQFSTDITSIDNETASGLRKVSNILDGAVSIFEDDMKQNKTIDPFNVISQLLSFVQKFLPAKQKHDILFYSTLMSKLIEGTHKVIDINMHLEKITYDVTLRHPESVKILLSLPPYIVGKAFEALSDANRIQILTSKINFPGQMFCDTNKIAEFFVISKNEASTIKKQLCSNAWKNYVSDLIKSFGIFEVKNNINNLASLIIQETLGQDTSSKLYSIEKDFEILKNFTNTLIRFGEEKKMEIQWNKIFNLPDDSEFMTVVKQKSHLGNQILITTHGALAKEVVKQNPILELKIAPILIDMIAVVEALNEQIGSAPAQVVAALKNLYGDIVVTVMKTALNEEKTYSSLSTASKDILCNGVETARDYLEFPDNIDRAGLVTTLCDATLAIENGLKNTSIIAKAINKIRSSPPGALDAINWTKLINGIKKLYVNINNDYTYLFDFSSYGMDEGTRKTVKELHDEAEAYWFGVRNLQRSLRLSVKLGLRFLDVLDCGVFDITDVTWLKIKHTLKNVNGPLNVFHETIDVVSGIIMGKAYATSLPPITVEALGIIIPKVPQLIVDAVKLVVHDETDVEPIINIMNSAPTWPCSNTSLADLLPISIESQAATKSLERLLCLDEELQAEWVQYLEMKQGKIQKLDNYNSSRYERNIFLNFSRTFDSLIDDVMKFKDMFQYIINDEGTEHLSLMSSLRYALDSLNTTERDDILRKFFNKLDTVLNSINTSSVDRLVPLNVILEDYIKCSNNRIIDASCKDTGRTAWMYTIRTLSVIFSNIADDLLTYFKEVNDPDSNLLQVMGFTKSTGLYILYDKIGDFVTVLLNSYWDYGFMSQVRRASLSQFWDCEAVVSALVPPAGSTIDATTLLKVQPYICPSFIYWLSLPRGDNKFLDIVAKPQYYFYTSDARNATSQYESAFTKAVELANFILNIAKQNKTFINEDEIKMNSLQGKLEKFADTILNFKIEKSNPQYILFNDINKKQISAMIYLARIVSMVNKMDAELQRFNVDELPDNNIDKNKTKEELKYINNMYKRKPVDTISFHYDVITDLLWANNKSYNLVESFEAMCDNLKNESKIILGGQRRTKIQFCAQDYKIIFDKIQTVVDGDYEAARLSLENLINILQDDDKKNLPDIYKFFNDRKQLLSSIKHNVKYSYDLGLPVYLKYLQSNIQSYNVITSFLSGGDWWNEAKNILNGPYTSAFFDYVEKSLDVASDVLINIDRIHLVRLLRDINVNETDAFCQSSINLSDYVPDSTGALSAMKQQLCTKNANELFKEIPPLLFAAQGYDNSLKVSKTIDYGKLSSDLTMVESKLDLIKDTPESPQRPSWATDDKINNLRNVAVSMLSKESLTKMSFGVLSNFVDAGTLFLNNSQCTLCSQLTSWFKQLNLQLFKKEEYDILLCQMQSMTMPEIYNTLKNNFHWDMAIKELIQTRNYTKYELNKSMNEFLELVKLHLLVDITASTTRLGECLASNVTKNIFGDAALSISVVSKIAHLLRSALPHIHEIEGIKDIQYLNQLHDKIGHKLNVMGPLNKYIKANSDIHEQLNKVISDLDVIDEIEASDVNLRSIREITMPSDENIKLNTMKWRHVCSKHNCTVIAMIIKNNLNETLVLTDLPKLQSKEFWKFSFMSNIIRHIEGVLSHAARLLGVASDLDVKGAMEGKLESIVDVVVTILSDDIVHSVLYSLQGIIQEVHPLLAGTALENDLESLSVGLKIMSDFKNYLLEEENLKLQVLKYFPDSEAMETSLSAVGINNTNFWSLAAPRIQDGYLELKPIFTQRVSHVADFVCQIDAMSQVIVPSDLDLVSSEDVMGAVVEQFCGVPDQRAKRIVPVLLENFNFSVVIGKLMDTLLSKLYTASNLTQENGNDVFTKYPEMAALLPVIQSNMADLSSTFANEPLFHSLQNFSSIGNLLAGSDFMADAGRMLCGKPFQASVPRLLKGFLNNEDHSNGPSQEQLDVLPTDFCRSLYTDITKVEGGKIVWSFIKPLIMGKILYTPVNPTVNMIIGKANATFETMIKMMNLVHSFAATFPSLETMLDHRHGLLVLKTLVTDPKFEGLRNMIIGDVGVPDLDVDGIFDQLGDLKGIGSLLSKASDLLHCFNMNRFKPSTDEEGMTIEAARLSQLDEFSAGIVFMNTKQQNGSLSNVEYKIRMDYENVPATRWTKNYLWIPGPESSFVEEMRYFRGFVQIQDMIDRAVIQLSRKRHKRDADDEVDWAMYTQQEPYPCYRKDLFQTSLYESQALIVAFFFSLVFTVASAIRFIVSDKESGNTMLMYVMGVEVRWQSLSWAACTAAELAVSACGAAAVLHFGRVLPHSDPTLLLVLLLIFVVSVLSFCYMMSKLFSSASLAAVCTALTYMITFMPFVLILSLEAVMNSQLKMLVCLSMSSSLCYAFLLVTRREAAGGGAEWGHVWEAPGEGDMSIGLAALMMIFDTCLYLFIGWLIDKYFGMQTLQSNITNCHTTDEKAGVSILNVTKIYGEGSRRPKLALDNVSIELQKGQITTLLGHNGAGKTTLIKILMGMLKPTKGHIIVRSDRGGGTELGVCPQKDVLFEYMTAEEHIQLYAQLKTGLGPREVQDEVDRMIRALSLDSQVRQAVSRWSGGARRRLCVALAFLGDPRLVSLDEPTSGVDPAARREIWSMIVKLKEDRTILLTTHHLDEAELLSDQIVIMHKGQVHTTGSPVEIKRTLGNGYKLTVVFPETTCEDRPEDLDEKTKQLLSTVRDDVKNANIVDVNDTDVEILLPFYDADGLSNDLHRLCLNLESQQPVLGYKTYAMDCSSLEQVFCDICTQADLGASQTDESKYVSIESPSEASASTRSRGGRAGGAVRGAVRGEGALRASCREMFAALMYARYLHHVRNRWLMFMLLLLPSVFVTVAMGFSSLRPPAVKEIALKLNADLYEGSTQYIVLQPSTYENNDEKYVGFGVDVLQNIAGGNNVTTWTSKDNPSCTCNITRQICDGDPAAVSTLAMMALPDVDTLNEWLLTSHEIYIEKRYGGFSSTVRDNKTNFITWYNNKGHHALPSYLNVMNNAIYRTVSGNRRANITVYTHPLKISSEKINKATLYQHIADAGISSLVLVAYGLVSAGAGVWLVAARTSQQKRLQLLCGVSPLMYWTAALTWDVIIIFINMIITAMVMLAFGFPVFVAKNNLPAICVLIMLYGFACGNLVHLLEKLFTEASLANMVLFCANSLLGLAGMTILLILDIISDSDATDNARWILHKIFLIAPQFALGDGLLEIAKNTIQSEVLSRFGMDTYQDPFRSSLLRLHVLALVVVGGALFLLNLAIEYDCFEIFLGRLRREKMPQTNYEELEPVEVAEERKKVRAALLHSAQGHIRVNTIGNINRGYVHTECDGKRVRRAARGGGAGVAQCVRLGKMYRRPALVDLTLSLPEGQCTALLGENGAGKSTTFSILTGEIRPTAGEVYLNEQKMTPRKLCQGLISYCPQSDAIDPLLTVREILSFYCQLRGITDQDDVIKRTLAMFELNSYSDVLSGNLSGGNKRKLCTAIAFMGRNPLVLLDEPTRFGGGHVVECRAPGAAGVAWGTVRARAPYAVLRVLHAHTLQFLLPNYVTVNEKETPIRLSDIFRLMNELQTAGEIEDYTVNQSSLEQMFLSFTDQRDVETGPIEMEPLPTPEFVKSEEEYDSITCL